MVMRERDIERLAEFFPLRECRHLDELDPDEGEREFVCRCKAGELLHCDCAEPPSHEVAFNN